MDINRRIVVAGVGLTVAPPSARYEHGERADVRLNREGDSAARSSRRADSILMEGVSGLPGCLSYIVAADPQDPDAIWITEAWQSKEAQGASLTLPSVRDAISKVVL